MNALISMTMLAGEDVERPLPIWTLFLLPWLVAVALVVMLAGLAVVRRRAADRPSSPMAALAAGVIVLHLGWAGLLHALGAPTVELQRIWRPIDDFHVLLTAGIFVAASGVLLTVVLSASSTRRSVPVMLAIGCAGLAAAVIWTLGLLVDGYANRT